MPNPWDMNWGTTDSAVVPKAPAAKPSPGAKNPWDRDWSRASDAARAGGPPPAPAPGPPKDKSEDLSRFSGRPGIPEASMSEQSKNLFLHFLDKEQQRPRFDPQTGKPAQPGFMETLDGARLRFNFFSNLAESLAKKGREYSAKLPEALGGIDLDTIAPKIRAGSATPAELFTYNNMLKDLVDGYKKSTEEDPKGFAETLKGTFAEATKNPGSFVGALAAGLIEDPEMSMLGGFGTGSKLAGTVKSYKKAAEAAGITAEAMAGGAAMSIAAQEAELGQVRLGRAAAEAAQIGAPMGLIHIGKGALKGKAKPGEAPSAEPAKEDHFEDPKSFGDYLNGQLTEMADRAGRIEPGPLPPREGAGLLPQWTTERLRGAQEANQARIAALEAVDTKRMDPGARDVHEEAIGHVRNEQREIMDALKQRGDRAGRLAVGAGIGASAAALAMSNDDVKDKATTGAIVAGVFLGAPEGGRAIGPLLRASQYGSRVLERLAERSPGKFEFGKQEIQGEINRQDIPKSERDVLERVLAALPGESLKAADLMHHFQLETQNFELKPQQTTRWGDYGMERIRPPDEKYVLGQTARTHVWKLPDSWNIPPKGHFAWAGPNQYGHSRFFMEGGVPHVMEMQSDLQQHLAPLSADDIAKTERDIAALDKGLGELKDIGRANGGRSFATQAVREDWQRIWPAFPYDIRDAARMYVAKIMPTLESTILDKVESGEVRTVTGPRQTIEAYYKSRLDKPVYNARTKNWERVTSFELVLRKVRVKDPSAPQGWTEIEAEDTHDVRVQYQPSTFSGVDRPGASRWTLEPTRVGEVLYGLLNEGWSPHSDFHAMLNEAAEKAKLKRGELDARLGDEPAKAVLREKLRPIGEKLWTRRLIQEEMARAGREGMDKIRFATADTVAKVEGWARLPDVSKVQAFPEALREMTGEGERDFPDMKGKVVYIMDPSGAGYHPQTLTGKARRFEPPEVMVAAGEPIVVEVETRTVEDYDVKEWHNIDKLPGMYEPGLEMKWSQQGIYDRYAGDTTKYLKQLGAKEVSDVHGHTWLEVPTRPGVPARMFGKADPVHLAKLAAIGVGAAAGAYFSDKDSKLAGAITGGLAATALLMAKPGMEQAIKDLRSKDTRIRINHIGDDREELIHRLAIDTVRTINEVVRIVPKHSEREHLTRWLRGDRSQPLNAAQQKALPIIRKWFQIPQLGGKTAKAAAARFTQGSKGMTDIIGIMGAFGNAIARSIADTRMLDTLEQTKTPSGSGLIAPPNRAPAGYVHVDHPLLTGYLVHPDIKASLKLILDTAHPAAAKRIAWTLMIGTKRLLVSASLFHATALTFAAQAASSNPLKFAKLYAQAAAPRIFGENIFLKTIREQGHAAPLINEAIQGGLTWSKGLESAAVEDVGNFYAGMYDIARLADNVSPMLGGTVRQLIKLNHAFDGFMWDRLHAGMKLDIFAEKLTQLLENNAKAHAADPGKVKLMSRREAANIAAAYSNSIFGGMNWRRAAEAVQSKLLRPATQAAFSPTSRRIAQVALFAPDWLVSTAAPWFVAAFGKGTGIKGLLNAQTLADLNRQYLIRSGLFYLVAGDAINHAMSGHHIWDNKNPLQIDMDSEGEKHMIFNKHLLEIPHMLQDPTKQTLGKLSFPVKEALNQLFGTEYLAPHLDNRTGQFSVGPKMQDEGTWMGKRLGHAVHGMEPISVQQAFGGGADRGLPGFFGLPVYGKTKEQRRSEAADRRRKRIQKQIDDMLNR